jgi:hypothetical protein
LSALPQNTTVTQQTVFNPGEPCSDDPNLRLVRDDFTGTLAAATCTGVPVVTSSTGTLTWSDGTTSQYTADIATCTVLRVGGHAVARMSGTINPDAAHYPGAVIHRLGLRKATSVTACLTGGSVPGSSGYGLVAIVK